MKKPRRVHLSLLVVLGLAGTLLVTASDIASGQPSPDTAQASTTMAMGDADDEALDSAQVGNLAAPLSGKKKKTRTPAPTSTPTAIPTATPTVDPNAMVFVGAGDIASCSSSGDEATAALLDAIAGTVFTLGDNAYDAGSASEFANCYNPSWGRHKARTRPAPGNHDYYTSGASGYYNYFSAAAGDPSKGYYSYDLAGWHIIVLNSNCWAVKGCGVGSPQEQWARADLAAHPALCTLAYWHHPRFSSGPHGSDPTYQAFWQTLYDARADVVLNGHDHDYERFAPQNPNGLADALRGLREFVVGTGGASHYGISSVIANSEVHNDNTFGVLKLTLYPASYDWQFVPQAGKTFTDSGSTLCH